VPVLTGIGHHVDRAVADEVAHQAFKTPTEAAEFLVRRVSASETRLAEARARLLRAAGHERERALRRFERVSEGLRGAVRRAERDSARVAELRDRLARLARRRLERGEREIARALAALAAAPRRRLGEAGKSSHALQVRLRQAGPRRLRAEEPRLVALERLCRELDPARVLARGFSITRDASGRVVRRPADVSAGNLLVTQLADGSLTSRVQETT
jgi:exodeoxyribonuclease VII large subunit